MIILYCEDRLTANVTNDLQAYKNMQLEQLRPEPYLELVIKLHTTHTSFGYVSNQYLAQLVGPGRETESAQCICV